MPDGASQGRLNCDGCRFVSTGRDGVPGHPPSASRRRARYAQQALSLPPRESGGTVRVIHAKLGGHMSDKPRIVPTPDGPYQMSGCRQLQGMMDGKVYDAEGTVFLCRCGGSRNKPFCDGTHKKIGFSGAKDPNRVPDQRDDYVGDEITIHDNRGICAHAARCTDNLKSVFRLGLEPWIDPHGDEAEKIAETIQQCPSGALSYTVGGVERRDRDSEPIILIVPNGPYAVRGGADLQGVEWGIGASHEHFTLCRCGKSSNKPFCSGAHWYHQFDEHAPPRE